MKRKSKLERLRPRGLLVGRLQAHLAIIVPPVATTTATVTEAIVIEAMTDTLLRDMSEYQLDNMLTSFWNADPLSQCITAIGGGTESAREVQEDGGIDSAFSIWLHVSFSCT